MSDLIKTTGIVKEIVRDNLFMIELEDGSLIQATISGKQSYYLKTPIKLGERLPLQLSPYDRTRGRVYHLGRWNRTSSADD